MIGRIDVIEVLRDPVVRVMGEVKDALDRKAGREESRGNDSDPFVDAAVLMRDAMHRFV